MRLTYMLAFASVLAFGCTSDHSGAGNPGDSTGGGGAGNNGGGGGGGGVVGMDAGDGNGNGNGNGNGDAGADAGGGMMTGFGTIFTIVLENHSAQDIVGSPNAPYVNSLINEWGLATNYKDSGTHPSLPNYLYLVSGDTQYFGLVDLDPTTYPFPVDKDNLGHQMTMAGIPWRSYQESAGDTCKLSGSGPYAPKHNPFLYFKNIQKDANGLCAQTSVDYSAFAADLAGGTYKYMFITPNLNDDGHDPTNDPVTGLKQSDTWLSTEVPKILASAAWKANGILFITWDEGEAQSNLDQVPLIVISPKLKQKGYKSQTAFTHASTLATVEDLLGLPRLGAAQKATNLMEFFQ